VLDLESGRCAPVARRQAESRKRRLARLLTSNPCSPKPTSRIRCVKQEMFLPIVMLHRYTDREKAMALANDTDMGLTAGF
jgi:hypothetical protein